MNHWHKLHSHCHTSFGINGTPLTAISSSNFNHMFFQFFLFLVTTTSDTCQHMNVTHVQALTHAPSRFMFPSSLTVMFAHLSLVFSGYIQSDNLSRIFSSIDFTTDIKIPTLSNNCSGKWHIYLYKFRNSKLRNILCYNVIHYVIESAVSS